MLLTALDPSQQLRTLRLDGITPDAALADHAIVLTDAIADDLDVAIGDPVTVATPAGSRELRVGATSDEPIPARAYLSLATAATIAGTDTLPINGLYLRVDLTSAGTIRTQLFDLPGTVSVKLRQEQRDDLQSPSPSSPPSSPSCSPSPSPWPSPVFNAMTINVLEREREYATMRSLGARPASIGRLLATEGAVLWLLALAPGLILGTWVAGRLGDAVAAGLFDLPVRITRPLLGTALGLLALTLIALALPLRRVANLDLASSTKTLVSRRPRGDLRRRSWRTSGAGTRRSTLRSVHDRGGHDEHQLSRRGFRESRASAWSPAASGPRRVRWLGK